MVHRSDPACPAELHGSAAARNGLGLLYQRRDECALLHRCDRESCAVGKQWPDRRVAKEDAAWRLFAFIALAFAGPRER